MHIFLIKERSSDVITIGVWGWKMNVKFSGISCSLLTKLHVHLPSPTVIAKARYSASVEDRDTVGYFLEAHAMRLFPKCTQKPIVDFLSSGQLAQLASLYVVRVGEP